MELQRLWALCDAFKDPCETETLRDRISPNLTVTAVKSFAPGAIQHTSSIHVPWSAALCQGIVLAMEGNEGGGTHLWMLIRKKRGKKGVSFLRFLFFVKLLGHRAEANQERIQHTVWELSNLGDSQQEKETSLHIYMVLLMQGFSKKNQLFFSNIGQMSCENSL